ncbi:MAG: hypothetical protein ABI881_15360 [Betaproteobacteria bacterium]
MSADRGGRLGVRTVEPHARELFEALSKINEYGEREFDGGKAFSNVLVNELIRRKWLEVRGRRLCRTTEGTWIVEGSFHALAALPGNPRRMRPGR